MSIIITKWSYHVLLFILVCSSEFEELSKKYKCVHGWTTPDKKQKQSKQQQQKRRRKNKNTETKGRKDKGGEGGGNKEDLNKEDLTPEAGWTLEVRK